jgi:glucosamine-6-phosphate deaminase
MGDTMRDDGPRIDVLPPAEWAMAVATELIERLSSRPDLRICLSTGATPAPFYAELLAAETAGRVSFGAATLILLDEWVGLPPGDPARCDVTLRATLVDRLRTPPAAYVPIDVDGPDPDAAAARHDAAATRLDLAILGLGMNGHVGLNEPGSLPDAPTRLVRVAVSTRDAAVARYGASLPPTAGITVGLARLLAADEAWLFVTGERKAEILRRVLEEPEGPDRPASYMRRHPRLTVFADEPAASRLRG